MNPVIRIGILSYGMSGKVFHAPLLHVNPGFAIASIMQRTGNSAHEKYPYAEIVRNAGDIIHDPKIDAVLVNTPDHTHYDFAREALEAGKHVVVEKPFVLDLKEGEALIELAEKKSKVLTVFQNRRWEGDFLTIRKIVEQKLLGHLVEFEAHFDRFRNFIRDSWKEKPENKSGTLFNLGSHLVDQAIVLFGMPSAVYADIRKQRTGAKVDDLFDLSLTYPEIKVTLKGSYLVREPGPRFILHGTEGSFVKYSTDPQEEALNAGHFPDEPGWGKEPEEKWGILNTTSGNLHFRGKIETLSGCYPEFYNRLYDTIVKGKELAVKPIESLNGIRIIKAAYESHEKQMAIRIH
jgi:scyllo-inositol 2-dehydrogenase (NADP+)